MTARVCLTAHPCPPAAATDPDQHATQEKPMTDWTPERLDALPEGTVIDAIMTVYDSNDPFRLIRDIPGWRYVDDGEYITTEALHEDADPGSIRVVSVPIDALLSQNALEAATDAFAMTTNLVGILGNEAEQAVRAAIAHVTGGTE